MTAIISPPKIEPKKFDDASAAVAHLSSLYAQQTEFLRDKFKEFAAGKPIDGEVTAYYPYVAMDVGRRDLRLDNIDPQASHGFVTRKGRYEANITRPDFFEPYYIEQLEALHRNHRVPIEVGVSHASIPLPFAYPNGMALEDQLDDDKLLQMKGVFDYPELDEMDYEAIQNDLFTSSEVFPLSLFSGQRIDLSLQRLRHYTGTDAGDFQNFVLFTNYDFYVEEFKAYAQKTLGRASAAGSHQYTQFIEARPNVQMPAYHLKRDDKNGITLINIGVGPSNAQNITDHLAPLRQQVWIMVGHCAGLTTTLRNGGYVLAHAYLRKDKIMDERLPLHIPVPNLAEVQQALRNAVIEVSGCGDKVDEILRTGTVATFDTRNWEFEISRHKKDLVLSNTAAVDMESGTIAANGYYYRVPYGALLRISDRPTHGDVKLPGMASIFYKTQTANHLRVAVRAMEIMREDPRLHSRKMTPYLGRPFR